jgi:hypothetical protein
MPVNMTITSSQTYTAPSAGRVSASLKARGGDGGADDPVHQSGGAGGGQGGSWELGNYPVAINQVVAFRLEAALAAIDIAVTSLNQNSLVGFSGANGQFVTPGAGGTTSRTGFAGYGSPSNGANGQGPSDSFGGYGGGNQNNRGTPTQQPMGGSYGQGGGGKGQNGPSNPNTQSGGGPGGPCVIMFTFTADD